MKSAAARAQPVAGPTVEELTAALAAMSPRARERILRKAGIDPGPRDWTTTGHRLGIPQAVDSDGHVYANWPREVWRSHRVYFMQAGDPDTEGLANVKIGFSTDVDERLRQLQTASPEPLKIINLTIGTQAVEAFIHRVLRKYRIRGEWFRLHRDDISEALARMVEEGISAW